MKPLQSYYAECIECKIRHSALKARKMNTSWRCMRQRAEVGRAQVIFFEEHKEQLIGEMVKLNLGKDLRKISGFLTQSFTDSFAGRSAYARRPAPRPSPFRTGGTTPQSRPAQGADFSTEVRERR